MFERDQHERHVLKYVARNNQDCEVDRALQELIPEVNEVNRDQVTSARDLYFHSDADVSRTPVDRLSFYPIDSARRFFYPSASGLESLIDYFPQCAGAI